jgi:hypothetical protein
MLTVAAIVLASGAAVAAPGKTYHRGHDGRGHLTPFERVMIANSAQRLAAIKFRAWKDGRLTFFERLQIRQAERRHAALVARAYRS